MRKSALRKQLDAIEAVRKTIEDDLTKEQALDVSAAQADLNTVNSRVEALTLERTKVLAFIDESNRVMQEQLKFQQNAMREHIEQMLTIFITEEQARAKALESRLRGMKGESNT